MKLQQALAADRRGDLLLAAALYEEVLIDGERSLPVLLNLAFLYWQATDPGLAAHAGLTMEFLATAGDRMSALLTEARTRCPASTEARFWEKYVAWAELDEPFTLGEARMLLREDPTVLAPALRVFAQSHGTEARDEAIELLRQSRAQGTTGTRYVVSVIEAVLARRD